MKISIIILTLLFLFFDVVCAQHRFVAQNDSVVLRRELGYLFIDTSAVVNNVISTGKTNIAVADYSSQSTKKSDYFIFLDANKANFTPHTTALDREMLTNIGDKHFVNRYVLRLASHNDNYNINGLLYTLHGQSKLIIGDNSNENGAYSVVPFPDDINRKLDGITSVYNNLEVKDNNSSISSKSISVEELLNSKALYYDNGSGENIEKLARAIENRLIDRSLVEKRIEEIKVSGQNTFKDTGDKRLTDEAWRFDALRKNIVAVGRNFNTITDLTDVEIGLMSNKSAQDLNLLPLLRRYTSRVVPSHPSILVNAANMRYYVVAAQSKEEINEIAEMLKEITPKFDNRIILLYFGSIDNSNLLEANLNGFDAVICGYGPTVIMADLLSQSLMGGVDVVASEKLPKVLKNKGFAPLELHKTRLGYAPPSSEGISEESLRKIDDAMRDMIRQKASPGGQVLVARNGQVIFNRAYGHDKYVKGSEVSLESIYDVASVTKVMATTPLLMRLYDDGTLDNKKRLGDLLPQIKGTNKADITMQNLLTHQAGLPAAISYTLYTIDSTSLSKSLYQSRFSKEYSIKVDDRLYMYSGVRYKASIFKTQPTEGFTIRVSENLYMNSDFKDKMLELIYDVPLRSKVYRYSDLTFYLSQLIVEKYLGDSENVLFDKIFAQPLGAQRMTFLPLEKYRESEIMPTEDDKAFRRELLRGYVHDPGAAMMGGVAGHAGLFSNANDLAKMAQMILNKGEYGGMRFIAPQTVDMFTSQQTEDNRRGLGFDKPDTSKPSPGLLGDPASPASFGHSGFTGTYVWIDPDYQIVYIFLSNRVYPNSYNKKLSDMQVRRKVQTIIYKSIVN